jgi:hypothetical protein
MSLIARIVIGSAVIDRCGPRDPLPSVFPRLPPQPCLSGSKSLTKRSTSASTELLIDVDDLSRPGNARTCSATLFT